MTPRVSDTVLYVDQSPNPAGGTRLVTRPAIVVEVNDNGTLTLFVIAPPAPFFISDARYDATGSPGSWHWPNDWIQRRKQ